MLRGILKSVILLLVHIKSRAITLLTGILRILDPLRPLFERHFVAEYGTKINFEEMQQDKRASERELLKTTNFLLMS